MQTFSRIIYEDVGGNTESQFNWIRVNLFIKDAYVKTVRYNIEKTSHI